MVRATVTAAACVGAVIVLAGCGLDSLGTPVHFGKQRVVASSAAAGATSSITPPPGAQSVLLRFANDFASLSVRSEPARQRGLLSLSTGALRVTISRDSSRARLAAIREMPAGARMVGASQIKRLVPTGTSAATGVIIVSERLTLADGASETPLIELYRATVWRTRQGWRVAAFSAQR